MGMDMQQDSCATTSMRTESDTGSGIEADNKGVKERVWTKLNNNLFGWRVRKTTMGVRTGRVGNILGSPPDRQH